MSHNSKNRRQVALRKQNTAQRKNGGGPAKTQKKNNKKNTWFARLAGKVAAAPAPKRQNDTDGDE